MNGPGPVQRSPRVVPTLPASGAPGDFIFSVADNAAYIANNAGAYQIVDTGTDTGTVSSVSVATANGISGSVANPTTTPEITLTLGAITPSSVVASGNIVSGNTASGLAVTATADGTTTLVAASKGIQIFTGSTAQTVVLPVVTTLPQIGFGYLIINNSSGVVTINSSGGQLVYGLGAGDSAIVTCILLTGTTAASWNVIAIPLASTLALITQSITNGDTTHAPSGDAVFDALALKADATPAINAQTGTTYSLQASDNGKVVTLSNGSAITLTIPAGLGVGFNCLCVQIGAGQVTFAASSTTLNQRQSFTKIAGQYGIASVVAYATNVFALGGDMAA